MNSIYVPSRQRPHMLRRTAQSWVDTGLPVNLMIGVDEVIDYARALVELGLENDIRILVEPDGVTTIGGARQAILKHSWADLEEFHIQVDDDMRVTPNLAQLVQALREEPMASGCGAWQNYYGLGMGKTNDESPDYERMYSSMGLQVKAYRTDVLMQAGGFDPDMRLAEDVDAVMRVAVRTGQYPLVHRRVVASSVNARGDAGGCASRGGHSSAAESTVDVLNDRYGPGTASLRVHKRTGEPRDTIWMREFWHRVEKTGKHA